MWQRHNAQLANFDVTSFACYGYCYDAAGDVQVICLNRSELKP
jgi:hypothetical protein